MVIYALGWLIEVSWCRLHGSSNATGLMMLVKVATSVRRSSIGGEVKLHSLAAVESAV